MKTFLLMAIFVAIMCGFDKVESNIKHIRRQNHKLIQLLKK